METVKELKKRIEFHVNLLKEMQEESSEIEILKEACRQYSMIFDGYGNLLEEALAIIRKKKNVNHRAD